MSTETASISLRGNRKKNQDRCLVLSDKDTHLLLLADGMGGHPRGEDAAQILIDCGRQLFRQTPRPILYPETFLATLLETANTEITAYGQRQHPPIDPRCTAVVALVQDGHAWWAHVGDSRLYLFREYQILVRTQDHSFVEEMHQLGLMEAAQTHTSRYRNLVTRCLGGKGEQFAFAQDGPRRLEPRDILLLCTDGLWSQMQDEQLRGLLRHHGSLTRMVRELALLAERNGHPRSDNITALAMRWDPEEKKPLPLQGSPGTDASDPLDAAIADLRAAIAHFDDSD